MVEKLEGKPVYDGEYCVGVSDTTRPAAFLSAV